METQWKEKKLDFGITNSSIWSNLSTATSNGSMNASIESFKPLQIAIMMLNMGMGEVILGGVGTGTITLIAFMILTTFIAGLMSDFTVSMDGQNYTSQSFWNINQSKAEKAYKNGINYITYNTFLCISNFSNINAISRNNKLNR